MVHLPALNTPQYGWCKTTLSRHPRPIAPVYQPEVAAEAVYFAAHARRREVWVDSSTAAAILGNKVLPALGDWYLSRRGFSAQQIPGTSSRCRDHNLYSPVRGDHGAHGVFDAESRESSFDLWRIRASGLLAGAAVLAIAGGVAAWAARRKVARGFPAGKTTERERGERWDREASALSRRR